MQQPVDKNPTPDVTPITARRWQPTVHVLGALRQLRQRQTLVTTAVPLVIIWVGLSVSSPYFLTVDNVANILLSAVPLGLVSGGMTLNLVAAEIDLSVGSVLALSSAVFAFCVVMWHIPWPIALVAALAVGAGVGFINAWFTTTIGMPSFVVTLAMMGIARGTALLITNGRAIVGLPASFDVIGQGHVGILPVAVLVAAAILFLLHIVLTRTRFGLNVYAVGGNPEAARIAGVDVHRTKAGVLILSALLASIAGLILGARLDVGSGSIGADLLLDAIAAVVIGGTSLFGGVGRITGTVLGVLLIASIRNGLVLLNVSDFWQEIAIGVLILLAVTIDHLAKERTD
jgi:ribose/xylose/arabinose/galactoside ABC-type transport system permease subunit